MKSRWIIVGLVLGLMGSAAGRALAEEDKSDPGMQPAASSGAQPAVPDAGKPGEPEPEYAFGTVKSVGGDQLTINEFDYDTGKENEATYGLDSKTEYENVASPKEITAGNEVDIDYLVKDGKKVAVTVSVAKPVEGEETE